MRSIELKYRLLLALLTLLALIFSWFAPIFTLTQLWVFEDQVSMVSILVQLAESGNLILALLIGVTSLLLPLAKVLLIIWLQLPLTARELYQQHIRWFERLGRWSMLDIWVVALSVVAIKLSAWLDAQIEYGLYLQLLLVALISWQSRALKGSPSQ